MPADTKTKRLSLIGYGMPFRLTLPEPDAEIDQADRQHLLGLYGGLLAAEPPIQARICSATFVITQRSATAELAQRSATAELTCC